jgi:tetratricopeptide (TPR) repeat protein
MFSQAEHAFIEGKIESARIQYSAIIGFIEDRNEPNLYDKATALKRLADCQRKLQSNEESINNHKKAFEINLAMGFTEGGIHNLNDLGSLYEEGGNYQESIAQYQQALALAVEDKQKELEAMIRNNIGYVLMLDGKEEEALKNLQESLNASRETGQKELEASTLANIAMLHKAWGLLERAKEYFGEAIMLNQEIEDADGELENYLGIGSVYLQLGNLEQSKKAFQRALELSTRIKEGCREPEIRVFLQQMESEALFIGITKNSFL